MVESKPKENDFGYFDQKEIEQFNDPYATSDRDKYDQPTANEDRFVDPASEFSNEVDHSYELQDRYDSDNGDKENSTVSSIEKKPDSGAVDLQIKALVKENPAALVVVPVVASLNGAFNGFLAGGILGAIQAGIVGMQSGLHRTPSFYPFLRQGFVMSGSQFGIWLGAYQGARSFMMVARGKRDTFNSLCGGFVAGVFSTARTRNPRTMLTAGALSALGVSLLDTITNISY